MKNKLKIQVNVLILVAILIGFLSVCMTSYYSYSKIIKDDIVNISKLTSTNIYSEISNELTKPIFVSLTMANDSFLKNWLKDEQSQVDSKEHQQKLIDYLEGIKEKYNYNSVFVVSDFSKIYYHYNGINKVVSEQNDHDQWYFNFLKSENTYDLEIDTDEANQNRLSVFVNCRIVDDDGNILGVAGVGLELNQIQALLKSFEDDFGLDAMLFDKEGSVKIHSDTNYIEKKNVFDMQTLNNNKQEILNNYYTLDVYQYHENKSSGYIITRYIDDLDWYLLIKKDTSILQKAFYEQLLKELIIIIPVILCVLLIVTKLMKQSDAILLRLAKIDTLTNMLNRRGFNESIDELLQDDKEDSPFYVFVLDIDNFKKVNDTYGHLIGDKIIKLVGNVATETLSDCGMIARWGGDEFAGCLRGSEDNVKIIVDSLFKRINDDTQLLQYKVTISMGITSSQKIDTVDTLLLRADKALYEAKETGRNRYIFK